MKTNLRLVGLALFVPLAAGCDDIHFGDPWETAPIHVSATELASGVDGLTPPSPTKVVSFHWEGFVAEEVRVEQCLYDCENQNDDFCWNKSDDYIENVILPREARHEEACPGWAVGACSSFADCDPDGEGIDYSQMIAPSIDYGSLPANWFLEGAAAGELEDGGYYAVGVFGFDCSEGEPCQEVFGCRMFRMVDGQPIERQGTES